MQIVPPFSIRYSSNNALESIFLGLPWWSRPPTLGRPLSPRGPVTWLPHSPAFPSIGVSDTPSSLHAQMWAFQLALRYRLQPLPRLGSHPQLLDPALSWGPITQLPVSSSLPTSCCHSPGPMPATLLFCVPAVSGPLKSALQNQPPDLSLLGGSRDSTWALDTRASAWHRQTSVRAHVLPVWHKLS